MIELGRRYVQYINMTYHSTGTLWDSRYKSSVIDSDRYLLACHCYIERNPVRAGMVASPGDYPWNSYRHYAQGARNPYLTEHSLYMALGADGPSRQAAYRHLHEGPENSAGLSEIRLAINQNQPLGDDRFHARIEAMTGQRREARPRGRPRRFPAGDLGPDAEQLDLPRPRWRADSLPRRQLRKYCLTRSS